MLFRSYDELNNTEDHHQTFSISSDSINNKNKVKRPLNAYNLFYLDRQPKLKSDNPLMSGNDISRQVGIEWKEMSIEEKKAYKERAQDIHDKFKKENPDYKYEKSSEKKNNKIKKNNDSSSFFHEVSHLFNQNSEDCMLLYIGSQFLSNYVLSRKDIYDDLCRSLNEAKLTNNTFSNDQNNFDNIVPEVE